MFAVIFYIENHRINMTFSSKEQIVLPSDIPCPFGLMARIQGREHSWFRIVLTSKQVGSKTSDTA
jgi:hypothetical protein